VRLLRNLMFVVLVCAIAWAKWTPVAAQTPFCAAHWEKCKPDCMADAPSCLTICRDKNPTWGYSGIDSPPGCGSPDDKCAWYEKYLFKDCVCDCPPPGGGGGGGDDGGGGGGFCGRDGDACFFDSDCCLGFCSWGNCTDFWFD
jgi:hypothetical protein